MTSRALIGIAAFLVASAICCQEKEPRVYIGSYPPAPPCPEILYEEVPKFTCPPEPCSCRFPMRPSDQYDEVRRQNFADNPDHKVTEIQRFFSRRHIHIMVEMDLSVLEVHRLAWEYLHGEVTQQEPELSRFVVRLLPNARWDVFQAIARARKHPRILGAHRMSVRPNPWPRSEEHPRPKVRRSDASAP